MSLGFAAILLAVLSILSAVLSAMETAVLSLREHQLEKIGESGGRISRAVAFAKEHPTLILNEVLLVGAVVNLSVALLCLLIIREHVTESKIAFAFALFGTVFFVTDVLPKAIALPRPRTLFKRTSGVVLVLHRLFGPIASGLERLSDRAAMALTPRNIRRNPALTEEELATLVDLRRDQGTLDEEESEVIQEILNLGNKTAKDCMTPRTDVLCLPSDTPPEEADSVIRNQHHWRIPIYEDQPDSITGVLDVRAHLAAGLSGIDYHDHVLPPVFVPETMEALDLFQDYLRGPDSMVVILDEFGGFEGIVSHTDMVEEFIGDAAPQLDVEPDTRAIDDHRLIVSGATRLEDIDEKLNVRLDTDDGIDTIGGLVFNTAGLLPERGVVVALAGGVTATVRKCGATRIEELLLEKTPAPEEESS